jgi:hypothetical protein
MEKQPLTWLIQQSRIKYFLKVYWFTSFWKIDSLVTPILLNNSVTCSGRHMTSLNCLSRMSNRMTISSIIFIWDGIIREMSTSSIRCTLMSNWVSQYRIPRSMWMSWHMYHTHIRILERLAFNQKTFSYLTCVYKLCMKLIFCLVRNTAIAIGWFMTSGHTWFDKYELRQIKNLMADLGYPHIFHSNACIRRSI